MADLGKLVLAVSVLSSLTVVLQLASQILSLYLLQLQRQQDFLMAQIALRKNAFVIRGRQKRRGQRKPRASWKKPGRIDRWWINLWQGYLPEDEWKYNLRMSREVFMKLVEELRPFISPDPRSPNRTALSAEKKLAQTLYFLKDTGSIRMTANAFGVAKSTVSSIICQAITSYLGPKYIRLPRTVDEMR